MRHPKFHGDVEDLLCIGHWNRSREDNQQGMGRQDSGVMISAWFEGGIMFEGVINIHKDSIGIGIGSDNLL